MSLINRALKHATSLRRNSALKNNFEIGISELHVRCFSVIFKSNWVSLEGERYLFWLPSLPTWPGARTDCPGLLFHQQLAGLYKPDSVSSSHYAAMPLINLTFRFVYAACLLPSVGTDRNRPEESIAPCRLVISLGDYAWASNEFKSLSHSNNSTRSRSIQTCLSVTK